MFEEPSKSLMMRKVWANNVSSALSCHQSVHIAPSKFPDDKGTPQAFNIDIQELNSHIFIFLCILSSSMNLHIRDAFWHQKKKNLIQCTKNYKFSSYF